MAANICDTYAYPYEDFTQKTWVLTVFVGLYLLVMTMSVGGNALVIWTVYSNKHMRTVTNYYIVNLATCDLMVAAFVLPLKLLEYVAPCSWQIFSHDSLCAALYFTLPVFVFASVLTLVAISLERFYAIVYPLNAKIISGKSRTRRIIATTWVISLILATPYLFCKSYPFNIYSEYGEISRQICNDRFDDIDAAIYGEAMRNSGRFRKGFFLFLFTVMYIMPSIIILYTCIRMAICLLKPIAIVTEKHATRRKMEENKRKVARMVITIAIAFLLSWAPFYLVNIISQLQKNSFLRTSNFLFTMLSTHLAGFINSSINPLIYITLSDKFRHSFKRILLGAICRVLRLFKCTSSQETTELKLGAMPAEKSGSVCQCFAELHSPYCSRCSDQCDNRHSPRMFPRSSWRTSAFYRYGNHSSGNGSTIRSMHPPVNDLSMIRKFQNHTTSFSEFMTNDTNGMPLNGWNMLSKKNKVTLQVEGSTRSPNNLEQCPLLISNPSIQNGMTQVQADINIVELCQDAAEDAGKGSPGSSQNTSETTA